MPCRFRHFLTKLIAIAFLVNTLAPLPLAQAEAAFGTPAPLLLPQAGERLLLSPLYQPSMLVGMQVNPKNPFQLNFIFDRGQEHLSDCLKRILYRQIVEYFMASLTIPNQDMWVNLSPFEKNRIIPNNFGQTYMGRDLLSQDYLLKQMTASLIYPEGEAGRKFWKEVYAQAQSKLGTTDIPVNTFNKVWIVPDKAQVYEKNNAVFIVSSHLRVMLEEDYLALQKQLPLHPFLDKKQPGNISPIFKEIILPALEKEINQGKNFARLRQIYSAMLMATWFKKTLRQSILGQAYADLSKVQGINLKDTRANERIYQEYLKAFRKGVFNFIREDYDPKTRETIARKYFSGGMVPYSPAMITEASDAAMADLSKDMASLSLDNVDVVLEQFYNRMVYPDEIAQRHLVGNDRDISNGVVFNESPNLGWIPLTVKGAKLKFVPRQSPGDYLSDSMEGQQQIPEDINIRETLALIEGMRQRLPLAHQGKMIFPYFSKKFNQLAAILAGEYEYTHDPEIKVLGEALGQIGIIFDRETSANAQFKADRGKLFEWLGLDKDKDEIDVKGLMEAVFQKAVQGVQIELESMTFLKGESSYKHSLETLPEKSNYRFNEILLTELKAENESLRSQETLEASEAQIKIIKIFLERIRRLPGWDYKKKFQGISDASPVMQEYTDETNCFSKCYLMALYLEEMGFDQVLTGDVLAYQDKSIPPDHVLLLIRLADGRYFQVEPSERPSDNPLDEPTRSHIVSLSGHELSNFKEGVILNLSKEQDLVFKTLYVGDWRRLLTAMFYTALGVALLRDNDIEGAIMAHHMAIALYPSSAAYDDLGVALTVKGDLPRAIQAFKSAINIKQDNTIAWTNLALCYRDAGQVENEITAYEESIKIDFEQDLSNDNLQKLYEETGQRERSVEFYQTIVHLNKFNAKAHNILISILEKDNEFKKAQEARRRAAEAFKEQVRLFPRNTAAHRNLIFYLNSVDLMEAKKAKANAVEIFRQDVEEDNKNPGTKKKSSELHNILGFFLFLNDEYDEAIKEYKKSLEFDPQNFMAWSNLGKVYWDHVDQKEALKVLERTKEEYKSNPTNKDIRAILQGLFAHFYADSGYVDFYRLETELHPDDSSAYNDLGFYLNKTGQVSGAEIAYRQAVKANPRNYTAMTNLGEVLYELLNIGEAANLFQAALRINPEYIHAHKDLQNIINENKRYQMGIGFYEELVHLYPDDKTVAGYLKDAVSVFQKLQDKVDANKLIVEQSPDDSKAWNNLGFAFYQIGDFSAAKEAYNRAIELDLHNDVAKRNFELILGDLAGLKAFYLKIVELQPDNAYAKAELDKLVNSAMTSTRGGIDFNENWLSMRVKKDGNAQAWAMPFGDRAMLDIQGLSPVIVRIVPFYLSILN